MQIQYSLMVGSNGLQEDVMAMDIDQGCIVTSADGLSCDPSASIPSLPKGNNVPNIVTSWSNVSAKRVLSCITNHDTGMLLLETIFEYQPP